MGKKSKAKVDFFDDEAETAVDDATKPTVEEGNTAAKKGAKKGHKKGKAKGGDWADTDDETPAASEPSEIAVSAKKVTSQGNKKGKKDKKPVVESDDDAPTTRQGGFAALGDLDAPDEEDGEDAEEAADAAEGAQGLVVALVKSVSKHPKADKLVVCSISTGIKTYQVVTNAMEVQAGMLVTFARAGCVTPGSGIAIKEAPMRGVNSQGMLCSAYDIGWTDAPDGILVQLPRSCQPGAPVPDSPPKDMGAKTSAKNNKTSKKNKKGKHVDNAFAALGVDDDDDEEPEEEADDLPQQQKQQKQKKSKSKAVANAFAALGVDDDEEPEEEVDDLPHKTQKKKPKSKAAANAFAALGLDDDGGEDADNDDAVLDEDNPQPAVLAKVAKVKKSKAQDVGNAFAALGLGHDGDEADDAGKQLESRPKSKKGKGKGKAVGSAFAALGLDDDEQDHDLDQGLGPSATTVAATGKHQRGSRAEATNASAGNLAVGEGAEQNGVAITEQQPSEGKKKKTSKGAKDVGDAFAALGLAGDDEEGVDVDGAETVKPAAVTGSISKKGKKAKSKAVSSSFAALGLVDDDEEEDEEVTAGPKAVNGTQGKAKGSTNDIGRAFASLGLDDDEEDGGVAERVEAPSFKKGNKKDKKKGKGGNADSAFAALGLDEGEDATEDMPEAMPVRANGDAKKGSKPATKSTDDADIDALLAELDEPTPTPAAAAKDSKKKKGKGGKADAAGNADDLDALLAEFGVEVKDKPAEDKKSKKKKKGKAAAKEEEDLDALLAEVGDEPQPAAPATDAVQPAAEAVPTGLADTGAAPAAAEVEKEEGEGGDEGDGDKEMSAAAKKKAKKKAREKAKKAAPKDSADAGEEEEETIESLERAGKKIPAAKRKMLEAIAAKRAAEEAARKAEEERRIQEEEELRRQEEEEQRKRDEAQRKKEAKKRRQEELRKAGKLLSAKEKEEQRRRDAERERLLKQAEELGVKLPDEPVKKKRPIYDNKKKQQSKGSAGDEAAIAAAAAAEAERVAEQRRNEQLAAEEAKRKAEEEAAAAETAQQESDDDDDDWENMDVETIKLPPALVAEEEKQKKMEEEAAAAAAAASAAAADVKDVVMQEPAKPEEEEESEREEEEEESEEEEEEEEEGSGSDEGSATQYSDSEEEETDESDSEEESDEESDMSIDSEEEREERRARAKAKRQARWSKALEQRSPDDLRSPICCILGHVDTGKTKILDNIRRTNVQEGEAGGITQQIGATYIPTDAIKKRTAELHPDGKYNIKFPALLVIDTPGHESFTNLRTRGSGLCDMAILVVDLMHGLEQQTIESINLLKMRKTPFIVALNKIDRLFDWQSRPDGAFLASYKSQKEYVRTEFHKRYEQVKLQLNEQGLNVALFWENPDVRKYVNIVPTSAITGEGIPDMLDLVVDLTQRMLEDRLMYVDELQCTVLEVKVIEGYGTTVDVVLVNGSLRVGDDIVLCGLHGPIETTIRSLLTPAPLKELRVKNSYLHPKEIRAAHGVKLAAQGLENAVAGTQLYVKRPDDDPEDLKLEVMEDMQDIFASVRRTAEGVCVQASTLGSLEALLEFLKSPDVQIPVSDVALGPVHRKDVMRANVMMEKGMKKYAVILAFDVPVTREARDAADSAGVKIFTADIIYHLFDQFTAYLKQVKEEEQQSALQVAVFPCILKILPTCVFNKKDPIVLGVEVVEGICRVGTPLCIPSQSFLDLGKIASLELNHKSVEIAKQGETVAMKIEATNTAEGQRAYGRHFDHKDELVSRISRASINALKEFFREDLTRDDWKLVVKLKHIFQIG